jgi:hypothetical protein
MEVFMSSDITSERLAVPCQRVLDRVALSWVSGRKPKLLNIPDPPKKAR